MEFLSKAPNWDVDGADWPHRDCSAFVETATYRWHVQRMGAGPTLLLIHGTGASTHSWAGLAPLLAKSFDVIAFDLPGHGFSKPLKHHALSLPSISREIVDLLVVMNVKPSAIIGHSAGAAIMAHMISRDMIPSEAAVSINGAFAPFGGAAGFIFPLTAKFLYYNPFTAYAVSQSAQDHRRVGKLIEQTGSTIGIDGILQYATLMSRPAHIAGALGMMAHWNLSAMESNLRQLKIPALFLAGSLDKAVRPEEAKRAADLAPCGTHIKMDNLGHLAHEEDPAKTAELIHDFAAKTNIV